jgi:hypothetical protein
MDPNHSLPPFSAEAEGHFARSFSPHAASVVRLSLDSTTFATPFQGENEISFFSQEDTPFSGIDERVLRELRKKFDSRTNVAHIVARAIADYTGTQTDIKRVGEIMASIVEQDVLQGLGCANSRDRGKELS